MVLYFGVLTEVTGRTSEECSAENGAALLSDLNKKYLLLKDYSFALTVNQKVVKENVSLNDGDEVALLPPFAGG